MSEKDRKRRLRIEQGDDGLFVIFYGERQRSAHSSKAHAEQVLEYYQQQIDAGGEPDWDPPEIIIDGRHLDDIVAESAAWRERRDPTKTGRDGLEERRRRQRESGLPTDEPPPWRAYAKSRILSAPLQVRASPDKVKFDWLKTHWKFEDRECPGRSSVLSIFKELRDDDKLPRRKKIQR
jgi:hypothetical protein